MTDPPGKERLAHWNARYLRGEETHGYLPAEPLPAAVRRVPPGRALDVACGAGRHAVYLAEQGFEVVAVDGARAGVDLMMREAERRGVSRRIEPHVADLMSRPRGFAIAESAYDLICDTFFLDRSLFPEIAAGLRPGGVLVAAFHLAGPGEPLDRRLARGELARLFAPLRLELELEEVPAAPEAGSPRGVARLLARRPTR